MKKDNDLKAYFVATILLFAIGLVFGFIFDYLHVLEEVIKYSPEVPRIAGVGAWIPVLYGISSVLIGYGYCLFDKVLIQNVRKIPSIQNLFSGFLGLSVVWLASGILPLSNIEILAILAPTSIALWFFLDRSLTGIAVVSLLILTGVPMEIYQSRLGWFHYVRPDWQGIALWLPCLHLAVSVGIGNISRAIMKP